MSRKFLIIEDHILFAQAFRFLMNEISGFEFVGHISDSREALEAILYQKPDYVFMDINMPFVKGTDLIRQIHEHRLSSKIIVVSMVSDPNIIAMLLNLGIHGFVPKNTDFEELNKAIHSAEKEEVYLPEQIRNDLHSHQLRIQKEKKDPENYDPGKILSEREMEILRLICRGYSNPEIADILFLSPLTVKTHRNNILKKLGLNNTASLIHFASQIGWI